MFMCTLTSSFRKVKYFSHKDELLQKVLLRTHVSYGVKELLFSSHCFYN